MKLTKSERELIEAIRDYLKSRHNPSLTLEFEARYLFDKIMEGNNE